MNEKDIKPGYYWARNVHPPHDWSIVLVDRYEDNETLDVYVAGDDVNYKISNFTNYVGPISPPTSGAAQEYPKSPSAHVGPSAPMGPSADTPNMITVRYWVLNTWPSSIDKKPSPEAQLDAIEVSPKEIYTKDGKRYYKLQSGHGVVTELLVE